MIKTKRHKWIKAKGQPYYQCGVCGMYKFIKQGAEPVYKRPDGLTDNTDTKNNCFKLSTK